MAEVEQLEQVDESLLRKILEVGKGCPKEMLFLELGCIPIRFTLMQRRIMFFHYILNEDEGSLINQVLQAQIRCPSKNDFILSVEDDLQELDIYLSVEEIKNLSKDRMRKFVKNQVNEKVLIFLNNLKKSHSKVLHINHSELKLQDYFHPTNVKSIQLSKFIYSARCRMLNVAVNFRNQNIGKLNCKFGCDSLDSQPHLLECVHMAGNEVIGSDESFSYEDLFSPQVKHQIRVAQILEEKYQKRKVQEEKIKKMLSEYLHSGRR